MAATNNTGIINHENDNRSGEHTCVLEMNIEVYASDLLRERDKLCGILDAMPNGVYIVNPQFKIVYANPALINEFGPIGGNSCHEYLHGSQDICSWCRNRDVLTGHTFQREWTSRITTKIYSTFDIPYKNAEGETCKLAILHDITAHKKAEQTIRDHNEELEHQVKERTRSLENANYELTVLNEELEQRRIELAEALSAAELATLAKSEFLSIMSHEIRTPLSAIIGFTDLALRGNLPPRQHDYVQKIQTAGELLLRIINDILDFSKMEAGHLEIEQIPFRLDSTLANAGTMMQQHVMSKGLKLLVTPIPEAAACLIGDPHRLEQIVVNLLSNAIKFTASGEVTLETILLARHNDRMQLRFTVCDTGIGISADHLSKLFQPFSQAEPSTTRRFGGTGLGLSISKQLVELLGGDIWCESAPGQGSSFYFTAWFGACHESDTGPAMSLTTISREEQWPSSDDDASSIPGDIAKLDAAVIAPILNKLQGYIRGRDGKAERYLDDYQRELSGMPEMDVRQIKKYLNNFDFVAAHDALLSISARLGIILTPNGAEESHL